MQRTILLALAVLTGTVTASEFSTHTPAYNPFERPPEPAFRPSITKTPGHYSTDDWQRAIDSVWGEGLPMETKQGIFAQCTFAIETQFGCFNDLDTTMWDSLKAAYAVELQDTVSRGRFAAMMCHLTMALQEGHTRACDTLVTDLTALVPGTPVHIVGGWRFDTHFGAGLTPLEDSTLVVYQVAPSHPLGLAPGDIILGYDGRPWTQCYRELLEAQLPIGRRWWWGSSPSSIPHALMISAGLNWHLFDTIDIWRYSDGDTVHLPTSLMVGYSPNIVNSEQLDLPEVAKPNVGIGEFVSYGTLGDSIGYIYVWAWFENGRAQFNEACSTLVADSRLQGIILDFRFIDGGEPRIGDRGLSWLFKDTVETFCRCVRSNPGDRLAMRVELPADSFAVPGNGVGYNKKIAVLLGPGSVSGGDMTAYRITYHDTVRTFGKQTNCAYNYPSRMYLHPQWVALYGSHECRVADDSTYYLTHRGFEPDSAVWHTRDSVAAGVDMVVKAAIRWIHSGIAEEPGPAVAARPVTATAVRNILRLQGRVPVALVDITGRKVMELEPGLNDIRHVAPGVYFARREDCSSTMKVVVQK